MKVYEAIQKVMSQINKTGIGKNQINNEQRYKFRGIDDVYNALAPAMAANGLIMIPRVLERSVTEKPTKSGRVLFCTVLDVEYDFVSAEDGSKHTARVIGEAMDSGDKSSNKAMSAAFKYAAFQVFCIPTEGDNDSENQTHEISATNPKAEEGLRNAKTMEELAQAWKALANADKRRLANVKEEMKEIISSAKKEANDENN
jgi:hypothetical protein